VFNKETEYALRSMVYIQVQNYNDKRPGISEIAKEIGAPPFYTAKILQRLVRQGFLNSLKGKGGGFYFDKSKSEIALKDLVSAIEGNKTFMGCGFGLKQCDDNNPCPLHNQFAPIREAIYKLLSKETIQGLAFKLLHGNETQFNWMG